jgi:hypothetical protein
MILYIKYSDTYTTITLQMVAMLGIKGNSAAGYCDRH